MANSKQAVYGVSFQSATERAPTIGVIPTPTATIAVARLVEPPRDPRRLHSCRKDGAHGKTEGVPGRVQGACSAVAAGVA